MSLIDLPQQILLRILAYACEEEYSDVGTTHVEYEEDIPVKTMLRNTCTLWQDLIDDPESKFQVKHTLQNSPLKPS